MIIRRCEHSDWGICESCLDGDIVQRLRDARLLAGPTDRRVMQAATVAIIELRDLLERCRNMLDREGAGWSDQVELIAEIDTALAAGTRRAETSETSARAEGCQSGGEAATPNRSTPPPSGDEHP